MIVNNGLTIKDSVSKKGRSWIMAVKMEKRKTIDCLERPERLSVSHGVRKKIRNIENKNIDFVNM